MLWGAQPPPPATYGHVFGQVVEEPYTVREARIHVRHVRDLLKSMDPADAFNGVDCASLAFLNTVTNGDILGKCGYLSPTETFWVSADTCHQRRHSG